MKRVIVLLLFLLASGARFGIAQQTIFNVPSQDILDPGHVYGEIDVPFRTADPTFIAAVPRIVVGFGANIEGGINFPGYVNPGDKLWTAIVAIKHGQSLDTTGPWTLTEGAHLYLPLTAGRTSGAFGYITTGYKFNGRLRLSVGLYGATDAVTGIGNAVGGLGSIEFSLTDWLTLAADGYSGKNGLGYISPGLFIIPSTNWILYPAYQFSNTDRSGDSFLLELGYSF